jgi:hypothetical protein
LPGVDDRDFVVGIPRHYLIIFSLSFHIEFPPIAMRCSQ